MLQAHLLNLESAPNESVLSKGSGGGAHAAGLFKGSNDGVLLQPASSSVDANPLR